MEFKLHMWRAPRIGPQRLQSLSSRYARISLKALLLPRLFCVLKERDPTIVSQCTTIYFFPFTYHLSPPPGPPTHLPERFITEWKWPKSCNITGYTWKALHVKDKRKFPSIMGPQHYHATGIRCSGIIKALNPSYMWKERLRSFETFRRHRVPLRRCRSRPDCWSRD